MRVDKGAQEEYTVSACLSHPSRNSRNQNRWLVTKGKWKKGHGKISIVISEIYCSNGQSSSKIVKQIILCKEKHEAR